MDRSARVLAALAIPLALALPCTRPQAVLAQSFPSQVCGNSSAGSSTIINSMPPGSLTHYGQNTIIGFPSNDSAGQAYLASLLSAASGPSSSPSPSSTTLPTVDVSRLSQTMLFATENSGGTFKCANLASYSRYTFVATVYVDKTITVNGKQQTYTGLGTYWKVTLSTFAPNRIALYRQPWTYVGSTVPGINLQ